MTVRRILVIAGSDSSGGAGLEADQKVIAAHGCYAMTATTALTAQNTQGVDDVHHIPPEFLKRQIHACANDIGVDVVKTGMLVSKLTVDVVAEYLREYQVKLSVVDPVMVATSGAELLPRSAVDSLLKDLLPLTYILTPNIPEAKLLLSEAGQQFAETLDTDGMVALAKAVKNLGPQYVLLKGGHAPLTEEKTVNGKPITVRTILNVLKGPGEELWCLRTGFLESPNTHGTGCSLASAIASNLACGMSVFDAVKHAGYYIEAGIKTSSSIGKGAGPINHFHSSYTLPFAPGRFIQYMIDRDDVRQAWKAHVEHDFVKCLGQGTLPMERFQNYLIQDYLFLIQFARATALTAYKYKTMAKIGEAASNLVSIKEETAMHLTFCGEFGLSREHVEAQSESQECMAYTRYVLDIGLSEDAFALQIALLPCLVGYGMIARRLADDPNTIRKGNPFWRWIETYISDDYVAAVARGSELVEGDAVHLSRSRVEDIVRIFVQATQLEKAFWEIGVARNGY